MKSNTDLDDGMSDESLRELRKAYHELEAFQLSDEHITTKNLLKSRLSEPGTISSDEK